MSTAGARLLDVVPTPPAPAVDAQSLASIVDELTARSVRGAVGVRAYAAPLLALLAGLVIWVDDTLWRQATVAALVSVAVAASAASELQARRTGRAPPQARNFIGTALAQLVMVTATGGVDSPLLPIVIPYALLTTLVMGSRPVTAAVLAAQLGVIAALTTLQATGLAPWLELEALGTSSAGRRVACGSVVGLILVAGSLLGLTIRRRLEAVVATALQEREDQLTHWVSWSHDLEAIGGEIAHELKNPLASVKGLAALVARDLPQGRAVERMEVLRTEADRMQSILDEFLTFSRPLTPLTLETLEPAELARRVVALHEGAARTRGVRLEVRGRARPLQADPRKLLQVLVNLVQNALAVPGEVVEVVVAEDGEAVVFEVLDRGPGIPEELRERVFTAGVTTKPDGHGLGLTIALAIARQHGGQLSLEPRPGGGTAARVRLP